MPPAGSNAVDLEKAAVTLGGRTIWQHATLSVPRGALIGLIGPNGTGKTTFLRLLLGQVKPSAGSVQVLGATPRRGNAAIGYVPQRKTLEADLALRGRDLVLLGLVGHRWGFGPASARSAWRCPRPSSRWVPRRSPINRSGSSRAASSSAC